MDKTLLALCLFFSFATARIKAQGVSLPPTEDILNKTEKTIFAFAKTNQLVFLMREKHEGIISLSFYTSEKSVIYQFFFIKSAFASRKKCFTYVITLSDKTTYETLTKQIHELCTTNVNPESCLQQKGSATCLWHYSGSDKSSLYSITCQKSKALTRLGS